MELSRQGNVRAVALYIVHVSQTQSLYQFSPKLDLLSDMRQWHKRALLSHRCSDGSSSGARTDIGDHQVGQINQFFKLVHQSFSGQ